MLDTHAAFNRLQAVGACGKSRKASMMTGQRLGIAVGLFAVSAWLLTGACESQPEPEPDPIDPALAVYCDPLRDLKAREGEVVTREEVQAVLGVGEEIPYIETQTQVSYLDGEAMAVWNNSDGSLFMVDRFFLCPEDLPSQ